MLVGKHGDHVGGERDAVKALLAGTVDAACVIDGNRLAFAREGAAAEPTRVAAPDAAVRPLQLHGARRRADRRSRGSASCCSRCRTTIREVRPLLDIEGLKAWQPGPHVAATRCSSARSIGSARSTAWLAARLIAEVVDLGDLGARRGRAPARQARARARAERGRACAGTAPTLAVDLPAWCRARGHARRRRVRRASTRIARGAADRWHGAERAGGDRRRAVAHAAGALGARRARRARRGRRAGARPSARRQARRCGPTRRRGSTRRPPPRSGIRRPRSRGTRRSTHPAEVEDAVVQVMTYLIENETAALLVPARFLGAPAPALPRGHAAARDPGRRRGAPHRGVHAARAPAPQRARALDRRRPGLARDAVRRARLRDRVASCSRCSARAASSSLLWFLHEHAPDACTREVARLAAQDEARHVAFGLAHLARHVGRGSVAARAARRRDRAPPRRARAHRRPQRARSSTRSSCSPPASWEPARLRARPRRGRRAAAARWTRAGARGWSRLGFAAAGRGARCRRCTRATSCSRRSALASRYALASQARRRCRDRARRDRAGRARPVVLGAEHRAARRREPDLDRVHRSAPRQAAARTRS